MAIKANKKRVMITLPKAQIEWLKNFCKNHDVTISHYISWIMAKKAEEMLFVLKIHQEGYTMEQLEEITKIIKTKWIGEEE